MRKKNLIAIGVIFLAGLVLFIATTYQQAQSSSRSEKNNAPVLDFDAESRAVLSKESKEKNKLFDSKSNFISKKQLAELPDGVEPLPTIVHWWVGLSALPVEQSDTVVIGKISKAEAHLSDDKTRLYSEFSIDVEQVFKNANGIVNSDSIISATRLGGSVRFGSGKINHYRTSGQGMPEEDGRYLLFLSPLKNGLYSIVTGYELARSKVVPIDGAGSKDSPSALPFDNYVGAEEKRLLQDLQTVLDAATKNGGNKQ